MTVSAACEQHMDECYPALEPGTTNLMDQVDNKLVPRGKYFGYDTYDCL